MEKEKYDYVVKTNKVLSPSYVTVEIEMRKWDDLDRGVTLLVR